MQLSERIDSGVPLLMDGAMGTELDRRKAQIDSRAWSASAMGAQQDTVQAIHADYVSAGAELHITNSFAMARHVLEPAGLGDSVRAYNQQAVALCRTEAQPGHWVAGSLSTYAADSDRSKLPTPDVLRQNFHEQATILATAGVDMLMLEMLFDVDATLIMAESAAATGLPICIGFTLRFDANDKLVRTYGSDVGPSAGWGFEDVLTAVLPLLPDATHTTLCIMHSEFDVTDAALDILRKQWQGPLAVYPNSGEYAAPHWLHDTVCSPREFVAANQRWLDVGVNIVGGCCGIGPAHIKALGDYLVSRK
jgi:homocysteine S-methyltransferase